VVSLLLLSCSARAADRSPQASAWTKRLRSLFNTLTRPARTLLTDLKSTLAIKLSSRVQQRIFQLTGRDGSKTGREVLWRLSPPLPRTKEVCVKQRQLTPSALLSSCDSARIMVPLT
jgi:hypothetical protein